MKIEFATAPTHVWHRWYAWHPVLTRSRHNKRSLVWLTTIERYYDENETAYRLLGEK